MNVKSKSDNKTDPMAVNKKKKKKTRNGKSARRGGRDKKKRKRWKENGTKFQNQNETVEDGREK